MPGRMEIHKYFIISYKGANKAVCPISDMSNFNISNYHFEIWNFSLGESAIPALHPRRRGHHPHEMHLTLPLLIESRTRKRSSDRNSRCLERRPHALSDSLPPPTPAPRVEESLRAERTRPMPTCRYADTKIPMNSTMDIAPPSTPSPMYRLVMSAIFGVS